MKLSVFPRKFVSGVDVTPKSQELGMLTLCTFGDLGDTYNTDAHCVTYIVEAFDGTRLLNHPRVNKSGLPFMREVGFQVKTQALFLDVDDPSDRERSMGVAKCAFPEAAYYATQNGYRIVQPLAEPVQVETGEAGIRWMFERAREAGIQPDPACKDWTRLFRLPHVRRNGVPFRSKTIDLNMTPIVLPSTLPVYVKEHRGPSTASAITLNWETTLSPQMQLVSTKLASIVPAIGRHEWHMRLAATLFELGIKTEAIPTVCLEVARRANYEKPADRARAARYTIEKCVNGHAARGFVGPMFHKVSEIVMPSNAMPLHIETPKMPLAEAERVYLKLLDDVGDETVIVHTPCGFGKTHGACKHALKIQQPVGISTPTIKNSEELQNMLGAANCARVFSPVQHPDCIYHNKLKDFSGSGLGFKQTFCHGRGGAGKCPAFDSCEVKSGIEGDKDSRILIGTHSSLSRVMEHAGDGMLFVDEPPDPFEIVHISKDEIKDMISRSRFFEPEIAYPICRVANALLHDTRTDEFQLDFDECNEVPAEISDHWGRMHKQPLTADTVRMLRASGIKQKDPLLTATKIFATLWHGAANTYWLAQKDGWSVLTESQNHRNILARTGPTVLLDATPEVTLAQRKGAPARIVTLDVRDRVQPTRTITVCDGRHDWVRANLDACLDHAAAWARRIDFDGPVGVYCHKDIAERLKRNLGALGELGHEVIVGNYGAVRGKNAWNHCGAYITIGDPRDYLPTMTRVAARLGCSPYDLMALRAIGELTQCHGRARTIRREQQVHMLHIGRVVPRGWAGLMLETKL